MLMGASGAGMTATNESTVSGPLVLEPVLVERIWGTQDLTPWHTGPAMGKPIGEIWLTAENCVVANGRMAGTSLAEVTARAGEQLGDACGEGFPLLIKLLFPREKLSVQVHPNDAEAQALGMPRGKTECWYVLSAEPGAQVALGFLEPLGNAEVKRAIEDGTLENKLRMVPVKAGDMVFVDAGTVHAIGPGMVVLETQQYSDTTYRLWDYGRPRELHVDAGTAVTRTETAAGLVAPRAMDGFDRLVECEYFAVDRFRAGEEHTSLGHAGKLQILIALENGCTLSGEGGQQTALPRGGAVILPASATKYQIRADTPSEVIRVLQP
jgi:mannose-6-phosphate isomerase